HGRLDGGPLDGLRPGARLGAPARLVPAARAGDGAAEPRVRRLVRPGRGRARAILLLMSELHSLVAPYALDALDESDERSFEEHLALCERCREDLAARREPAAALAYATPAAAPPPQLKQRILEQARSERPNVVPLRRPTAWR